MRGLFICGYTSVMDAVQRLARLEQRISELAAGKDIDAAHINVLFSPAQQREFDWQWRQQASRRLTTQISRTQMVRNMRLGYAGLHELPIRGFDQDLLWGRIHLDQFDAQCKQRYGQPGIHTRP